MGAEQRWKHLRRLTFDVILNNSSNNLQIIACIEILESAGDLTVDAPPCPVQEPAIAPLSLDHTRMLLHYRRFQETQCQLHVMLVMRGTR